MGSRCGRPIGARRICFAAPAGRLRSPPLAAGRLLGGALAGANLECSRAEPPPSAPLAPAPTQSGVRRPPHTLRGLGTARVYKRLRRPCLWLAPRGGRRPSSRRPGRPPPRRPRVCSFLPLRGLARGPPLSGGAPHCARPPRRPMCGILSVGGPRSSARRRGPLRCALSAPGPLLRCGGLSPPPCRCGYAAPKGPPTASPLRGCLLYCLDNPGGYGCIVALSLNVLRRLWLLGAVI